jgi:hypothetical protein
MVERRMPNNREGQNYWGNKEMCQRIEWVVKEEQQIICWGIKGTRNNKMG